MTSLQNPPLEPARQGDPQAISKLLNRSFAPHGITAKVVFNQGCLAILLTSAAVPDREQSVAWIERKIADLKSPVIRQIQVRGQKEGSQVAAWSHKIDIAPILPDPSPNGESQSTLVTPEKEQPATTQKPNQKRKVYQFLQIRVQLLGRGMTNEIMNLYINGKRLRPKAKTLHEFLNYLGSLGFQVITAELETEGVYTHFYTMQRQAYTSELPPQEDIFDLLQKTKEGADFGDSIRSFLEFSLLADNL